jgi:hypothetical protein
MTDRHIVPDIWASQEVFVGWGFEGREVSLLGSKKLIIPIQKSAESMIPERIIIMTVSGDISLASFGAQHHPNGQWLEWGGALGAVVALRI